MFLFHDKPEPEWSPEPLHTRPLAEVLDMPRLDDAMAGRHEDLVAAGVISLERHAWSVREHATPCGIDEYVIGEWGNWRRGWLVAFEASTMTPVGGVVDDFFYVVPEHRGRGLGSEILIRAYETGIKHPIGDRNHSLSDAARAALTSAHRKAVTRALEAEDHVPDQVLADYPDLAPPRPAPTGTRP